MSKKRRIVWTIKDNFMVFAFQDVEKGFRGSCMAEHKDNLWYVYCNVLDDDLGEHDTYDDVVTGALKPEELVEKVVSDIISEFSDYREEILSSIEEE